MQMLQFSLSEMLFTLVPHLHLATLQALIISSKRLSFQSGKVQIPSSLGWTLMLVFVNYLWLSVSLIWLWSS